MLPTHPHIYGTVNDDGKDFFLNPFTLINSKHIQIMNSLIMPNVLVTHSQQLSNSS